MAVKEVQIKFSNFNFPLENQIFNCTEKDKFIACCQYRVSWGTQPTEHSFLVFHSEYERWENIKKKRKLKFVKKQSRFKDLKIPHNSFLP